MIIIITGPSHTGKTALAQKLLEKYHFPYLSVDHLKMGLIRSGMTELTPESELERLPADVMKTTVRRENNKFVVEGEWLFNFMDKINFYDYESLNFFQRVLIKNGVIDKLREAGVEEGDTVSIYDFEFDFVY